MSGKKLNIGARIQSRRKSMGISQEELAQRMGVSRQSVTKWETGASAPELERVVQLSDVLGVGLDYLLRDDAPSWEPARDAGNQPFALSAGANVLLGLTPKKARRPSRRGKPSPKFRKRGTVTVLSGGPVFFFSFWGSRDYSFYGSFHGFIPCGSRIGTVRGIQGSWASPWRMISVSCCGARWP